MKKRPRATKRWKRIFWFLTFFAEKLYKKIMFSAFSTKNGKNVKHQKTLPTICGFRSLLYFKSSTKKSGKKTKSCLTLKINFQNVLKKYFRGFRYAVIMVNLFFLLFRWIKCQAEKTLSTIWDSTSLLYFIKSSTKNSGKKPKGCLILKINFWNFMTVYCAAIMVYNEKWQN